MKHIKKLLAFIFGGSTAPKTEDLGDLEIKNPTKVGTHLVKDAGEMMHRAWTETSPETQNKIFNSMNYGKM